MLYPEIIDCAHLCQVLGVAKWSIFSFFSLVNQFAADENQTYNLFLNTNFHWYSRKVWVLSRVKTKVCPISQVSRVVRHTNTSFTSPTRLIKSELYTWILAWYLAFHFGNWLCQRENVYVCVSASGPRLWEKNRGREKPHYSALRCDREKKIIFLESGEKICSFDTKIVVLCPMNKKFSITAEAEVRAKIRLFFLSK